MPLQRLERSLSSVFVVIALALSSLLLSASSARAEEPLLLNSITVDGDRIWRNSPDQDEPLWEITHLSLRQDDISSPFAPKAEITTPILWDGALYYGLFNWLIRLDPEQGIIESRHLFPANITEILVQEEHLQIQVEVIDELRPDSVIPVSFRFRPGSEAPQELWSLLGLLSPLQDASHFIPGINRAGPPPPGEERDEQLDWLKEQATKDQTNPFYDYYQGVLHLGAGDHHQADRAFEKMFSKPAVHWSTWVMLVSFLDKVGASEWADKVFDKAYRSLEADDSISLRRWSPIMGMVFFSGWSRHEIDTAVQENDLERVHRSQERIALLFPQVQQSRSIWLTLANWFDSHDRPDLAERWRARVQDSPRSPFEEVASSQELRADLAYLILLSLVFGGTLGGLLIGMRHAGRPDQNRWLPTASPSEWAALAITFMLCPLFSGVQQASIAKIDDFGIMPVEVGIEGWSSPNAQQWIADLHPSDARDQLLQQIQGFSKATYQGQLSTFDGPTPNPELLAQAIQKDLNNGLLQSIKKAYLGGDDSLGFKELIPMILLLSTALYLFIIIFIGNFIGSLYPKAYTYVRCFIPGAARSASLLTPFICSAFTLSTAALFFKYPLPLHHLTVSSLSNHFGLGSIFSEIHYRYSSPIFWWILSLALFLHIFTLICDLRSEENLNIKAR